MAVFCPKGNKEKHPRERNPETMCKNSIRKRNPRIQGLAVTPSGKGRGNGKKPIWEGGEEKGEGMRDGMKFLHEGEYVS